MIFEKTTLENVSIGKGVYGIGASAVPYSSQLYRYLRITDIAENGEIDENQLVSVNDKNAIKYILKKNDVCFARTGNSTGKSYFYETDIKNLVFAGFLIKFSLDDKKINPRYMKYYTLTSEYKNWVVEIQTESTRGNINANMYENMPLYLPPRNYQDKMVKILDNITDIIIPTIQMNNNLLKIINIELSITEIFDFEQGIEFTTHNYIISTMLKDIQMPTFSDILFSIVYYKFYYISFGLGAELIIFFFFIFLNNFFHFCN